MTNLNYKLLSDSIVKPDIDDRLYKLIQLPNGLNALLISDKETDKSAAALDVNIGSFHDPKDLPGLAHFCEHLLFMGTEKYPSENEYSNYLSKNNGFSNAFTSSLHTNYYFEVSNDAMEGAIDRFSQFFISPLFNPDCKDREINAVDSENKKNLQNDSWRFYQLSKSLTNPNHPYNGFSTGNKETLNNIPVEKGLDVRDELLKFYDLNYSSNLMNLVILSNQPLDSMINWTIENFSKIPNKNNSKPFFKVSPFHSDKLIGNLVKVKPVMDQRVLQLSFPIPDSLPFWEANPLKYLSHLIGHESKGSLLDNFKTKGWSNSLSSGGLNISPGYSMFMIDIELTLNGLENYQNIIKDVFKYIKMLELKTPQSWVFEEIKEINEMNFKFKQKSNPSSTVSKYAGLLHNLSYYDTDYNVPLFQIDEIPSLKRIPYENFLNYSNLKEFQPEIISKFLSYLNPGNFKANLIDKNFTDEEVNLNEKWYNTQYSISKIDETLMNELVEISTNGKELDANYDLPEKNAFIATNFDLVEEDSEKLVKSPRLIKSNENLKIWYKNSNQLSGPRSSLTLKFNLPGSSSTPFNSTLLTLFVELLEDELNSMSYLAALAGLSQEYNVARDGISLEIYGYSHKIDILSEKLIDTLTKFVSRSEIGDKETIWNDKRLERFDILKEKTLRSFKNFGYSVPYNQVGPMISGLINENAWLIDDQIACYQNVTYDHLKNFAFNLFSLCQLEVLVVGNIDKVKTLKISTEIEEKFFQKKEFKSLSSSLTNSQFTKGRSLNLPLNESYQYVKLNDDPKNINSCIEMFIQTGEIAKSGRDRLLTELVSQILHEPFFNRLRTQEQLGYVVFSGLRETRTTFGLRLLVQSERSTTYLMKRINKFLNEKMSVFFNKELDEEEFQKHVNAVIQKKQLKVKNLKEEKSRYWNRIATGFYDFSRRIDDVELLKDIKLKELVDFYNSKILDDTANGKLVVHLISQSVPVVKKNSFIFASISNYCYSNNVEIKNNTDLSNLIDEKVTDESIVNQEFLKGIFGEAKEKLNEIIPSFAKLESQLIEYIIEEINLDYNKLPIDGVKSHLIDNIGDFKAKVPLTSAAYPLVDLNEFSDESINPKL